MVLFFYNLYIMINNFYDAALWKLPKSQIGPRQLQSHPSHTNALRNLGTIIGIGIEIVVDAIVDVVADAFTAATDVGDVALPEMVSAQVGFLTKKITKLFAAFSIWEGVGGFNYWLNSRPGQGGNNWMTDILNFGLPILGAGKAIKEIPNERLNARLIKSFEKLKKSSNIREKQLMDQLINQYNPLHDANDVFFEKRVNEINENRLVVINLEKQLVNIGIIKTPIIGDVGEDIFEDNRQTLEFESFLRKIGFNEQEIKELIPLLSTKNRESLNEGLNLIYKKIIESNKYSPEITQELLSMIQEAIDTNVMKDNVSAIVAAFKAINKKYKIMEASSRETYLSKFGIKPYMTTSQKMRRFLASHKFRHDYVDRLKYLNPSMAARKPINYAYRQLEKIFGKYFKKMFSDDTKQVIKKGFKLSKREIKRMIRKGETINLNSQWLNSLRVIKPSPELNLTLITFDEKITYGKEPVFIWATIKELEELIRSPGRTYINKFAISRGGKSVGVLGLFGIKGNKFANKVFSNVFQFLPIQAVRNVLSVLGNFKREIPKMKNGTYFKTYLDDYRKAFINYGIGRATRLIARGILAPALTNSGIFDKAFAKAFKTNDLGKIRREVRRFVGMELQRYGTATFSYGIKNELKGQSFTHGLGNRLTYAITRTPRDQIAHYERERTHGNQSFGVKQIRYLRITKIYRRIPNTFMSKNFKKRFY